MKRLWTFITAKKLEAHYAALKEALFAKAPLRILCYFLVIAALVAYWLTAPAGVVRFVYDAF